MGSLVAVASRIRNKEGVVYMNLVGKIFTVLIFIMSLVFASLTVAVYATHRNWREVLLNEDISSGDLGVQHQLAQQTKEREDLQNYLAELEKNIQTELEAKVQALEKLEGTYAELQAAKNALEESQAVVERKASLGVAEMALAHKTMNGLRAENKILRKNIIAAENEKDARQLKIVEITDKLHQGVLQLQLLRKQTIKVQEDLIKTKALLALRGISIDTPLEDVVPDVEGIVTATPSREMVEISIGSDDALHPGHQLDVRRGVGGGARYIGRIEVVRTEADKAACKVLPKWSQGQLIRKGDRVRTVQP
jgi:hypothetical protein